MSAHLGELRERIESALDGYLPVPRPEHDWAPDACPSVLAEAMRYAVLGGGKRLRPVLALLAAEACGATPEAAMPAACALEMIHAYSLIHDDLPCMDDDDLRRGRPTCHIRFDEATALLAGDALLTLAFEITASQLAGPAAARCTAVLARAAGASGMVGGQTMDLAAEDIPAADGDATRLEAIHRRKTGALLQAALELGGLCADATPEVLSALVTYGRAVGLAFQIVDDLLDVQGDESKLGKRVGKDLQIGKWTYPAFLGIAESQKRARDLAREADAAMDVLGVRSRWLRALAWDLVERDR